MVNGDVYEMKMINNNIKKLEIDYKPLSVIQERLTRKYYWTSSNKIVLDSIYMRINIYIYKETNI